MTINISASPAKFYQPDGGLVEISMLANGELVRMEFDTGAIVSQEFVDSQPDKPVLKLRNVEWCHPEDGTLYHGVILATEFWKAPK